VRDIIYKSTACGPGGSFQPGEKRHDVPDAEAAALVNGGYALYADAVRPTLAAPVREQAIPTLGEQAVGVGNPVAPTRPETRAPRRGK
jgi:hypothetical protein